MIIHDTPVLLNCAFNHFIAILAINPHRPTHYSLIIPMQESKSDCQFPISYLFLFLPLSLLFRPFLLLFLPLLPPLFLHYATKRLLLLKQTTICSSSPYSFLTLYRSTHTQTERHSELQHLQRRHVYPLCHPLLPTLNCHFASKTEASHLGFEFTQLLHILQNETTIPSLLSFKGTQSNSHRLYVGQISQEELNALCEARLANRQVIQRV